MFYSTQTLRAAIRETPEGRVYHPWNRGEGYLVDAPTERRLARFLDGYFFGQIALMMPFISWGSETGHRAVAIVPYVATLRTVRHLCLRHVLRAAPRTVARLDKAEAWQRVAAEFGVGRICLMGLLFFIMPLVLILGAKNEERWDFALLIAMSLAMAGWGLFHCVRLLRIKSASRPTPDSLGG